MVLRELLKTIQPIQVIGSIETEITGVNIDSRQITAGHLFMAMRGTQTDGHAYIAAAIEKGAVAVLCEEVPEERKEDVTYIQVKDSEDAVGKVATTFYNDPTSKIELVGVTGTNGKTTIATLLYHTFRYFGYKVGLISTVCNYIDDLPERPREPICLHGGQFTLHRPETHQRPALCRRHLQQPDARPSGLSQDGGELPESQEEVL